MFAFTAAIALLPLLLASPVAPRDQGVLIQATDGTCLTVTPGREHIFAGLQVSYTDCSKALRWNINRGSGVVELSEYAGYVLDAEVSPNEPLQNGNMLKIENNKGKPSQTWYWTDDNRIAITGGTHCLDKAEGALPQIWQCFTGNTNQEFSVHA